MKKLFFLLGLIFLLTELIAAEPIFVNESVTLEVTDDGYIVDFRPPYCEERTTDVKSLSTKGNFSRIAFGKDQKSLALAYDKRDENVEDQEDIFDYVEGEGVPNIPFVTLNLQIPQDAKYTVKIEDIQYVDLGTGKISSKPIPYKLKYPYAPCQEVPAGKELKEIQFDKKEYTRKQYNELYTISEPYGAMGTQGFTFNMYPFVYFPAEQSVVAIHSARFVISVDAKMSLSEMMDKELSSKSKAASGTYLYDNYLGTIKKSTITTDKGRYLIITTCDRYAEALSPYITHKRECGYDVMLHVQNGGYPNNAVGLRNYIKSMYDNIGSRPQYVLLVGDYAEIPVSYGVLENGDNPPTDIYYACLEKTTIGTETNFYPEVYIGRWPVGNGFEVTDIANKVINAERNQYWSRVFELYSGVDSDNFYTNYFNSDNKTAANKLAKIHLATVRNFKGSEGANSNTMRSEFINWNVLMLIYTGHGSKQSLGTPYGSISSWSLNSLTNTPYYMVAFACVLNHPALDSFGPSLMRKGDRAIAFYGSTANVTTISDSYLSKHIFDYFKSVQNNIPYSQLMEYSAGKYYNALKTAARKKETKKYLFLGDPTAFTLGMTSYSGNPISYIKEKVTNSNDLNINEEEQVMVINIFDSMGNLVYSNPNVVDNNEIFNMKNILHAGIYIFQIKTTKREYVQKITL